MKYVRCSLLLLVCGFIGRLSLYGVQKMYLEQVGPQKPYISEAMTNKLISVALAGMKESKHWSHFVPSQKVLVVYEPKGCRCLGITNASWVVEFGPRNRPEYRVGGGVAVTLDAKSFKVLSVLGTK